MPACKCKCNCNKCKHTGSFANGAPGYSPKKPKTVGSFSDTGA